MTALDCSVVVIGGGFGGLSTACYLADAGADVTVVEKNEQLGGRASTLERDGFRFDLGPSWYLMPDVFERFFGHFDRRPEAYYELTHLDPHYRVFFKDGKAGDRPVPAGDASDGPVTAGDGGNIVGEIEEEATDDVHYVDATANRDRMKRVFEAYEPGAGDALDRYLTKAKETYEVGMEQFVYTDRPRFRDYVDWNVVRNARGLSLLGSMQDHVENYFEHPKLQQLVQYSLVFLGGAPTNTPALYNLMSHVDFNLGVYYPDGGMGAVVDGIVDLGEELGVTYYTDREVTTIDGSAGEFRVRGDGWSETCDLVVSNADYAHTEQQLLSKEKRQYDADYWDTRTYAPSAFLMYLGVEGSLDRLAHHTLVLPTDWNHHFEQIFSNPAWPDDPAYYMCVPSRTDDSVAPDGCANLFVLVPIAPGLEDGPESRSRYREAILDDIAAHTGVELRDRILLEEHFCVSEFASRYHSREGSALGLAHTLRQTGPLRPNRCSTAVDGLYFTGSYTTPGIGVPMCLISGEHTANAILDAYATEAGG